MGKPVTVDSDDIEVLLHAAYVGREVEKILSVIKNDPAMIRLQAKGKIAEAMDRVSNLRARAIREDPSGVPADWVPSGEQLSTLKRLSAAGPLGLSSDEVQSYATLRRYGLVVAGQVNEVVSWGDKTQSAQACGFQRFKLTDTGAAWVRENTSMSPAHKEGNNNG